MHSGEVEALIERLVANPHDGDALSRAHQQGEADAQGYAYLLEQVGTRTEDPAYASHWLSEAANIWSVTLGDAHRAARVLMIAVDRDPTQPLAADRLAQLYRDKGDTKALVAMLDRRVRLLTPMLTSQPESAAELRALLSGLHEELGKLWSEPPLEQPKKAVDHYKRSIELDPTAQFSIFSVREIYKSLGSWDDAIPMYAMELALTEDPERRVSLLRDEAMARRSAGDLAGTSKALAGALEELRAAGGDDPALAQEVASSLLDRVEAGSKLDDREKAYGADILVGLSESFGGEHGLAYAAGALDLAPGHDRAMQLFAHHGAASGNVDEAALTTRYHAYLGANPKGRVAKDARLNLAASYEAVGQPLQAMQVLTPLRGQADVDLRLAALESTLPPGTETPMGGVNELDELTAMDASEPLDTDEVPEAPPPGARRVRQGALDAARAAVAKKDKNTALERYLEVLTGDPLEPEALSWVEDTLRTKRDYAKLRDVLWASARAMSTSESLDSKKLRLREIAGLSESNLKDLDGAISAWRQLVSLDRGDDSARQALIRALEKGQRWDDLANVYEQEASTGADDDAKIQLEKKLATLHSQKRNDPAAAAEAWARIAAMTPEDDDAVTKAVDLYEKADKINDAATFLTERSETITDTGAKAALLDRLGKILSRESSAKDLVAAAKAHQRAAETEPTEARWSAAESTFADAGEWNDASTAAERVGELSGKEDKTVHAVALARAADYLQRGADLVGAIRLLERAHELSPATDSHATQLIEAYRASSEIGKLADFLDARGTTHSDKATRIASLREAAVLYEAPPLTDPARAREIWQKLLEIEEQAEPLEHLVELAISRDDLADGAALLRRLGALATTNEAKTSVALREAELLSRTKDSVDASIARYDFVLETLDPKSRVALRAIANLEDGRGAPKAAAAALERELVLTEDAPARVEIATRLARTYEGLGDEPGTFAALEALRKADPEDFDTLNRLVVLAEKLERWEPLVSLLAEQIDIEADDGEISSLTRKRAATLADKLGRGDEALAALGELADGGDDAAREAYVALGDKQGWRGIVGTKLVEWWLGAPPSEPRIAALVGAFERFAAVGRDADAVRVGIEVLRTSRNATLAAQIETLAAKTGSEAGVTAAQELLGLELNGKERAAELVRQAETRVQAGMPWAESIQHGETALGGLTPADTDPLLARLAALSPEDAAVIDLYERQVSRSRGGEAREHALSRAAEVAGRRGDFKRARVFFDLALSGTPSETTLDALTRAARGDGAGGEGKELCRALAEAMAHGGEGVRDGGRSRSNLLRRAAEIAETDLADIEQAFNWITEGLIAHADAVSLDALESLAGGAGLPKRIDDVLTRVLSEVFDGPLVRLLLARRAKVRKERLEDRTGAAADLKKLHDLSPNDEAVMTELAGLLVDLGDHRAMIQLYEDQILRSKDQGVRAELGRKVARIWEGELSDAREAADAWRRVLRLRPGDEEATTGLERAKTNMLQKRDAAPSTLRASVPPPRSSIAPATTPSVAPPAPATTKSVPPVAEETPDVPAVATDPPPPEAPIPEPPPSVQEVDESDLEPDKPMTKQSPRLADILADDDDPFAQEADTTHTAIDVRRAIITAETLDNRPPSPPASSAPMNSRERSRAAIPAGRPSKPPPLPPSTQPPASATSLHHRPELSSITGEVAAPPTEQALGMTEENVPFGFHDLPTESEVHTLPQVPRRRDIPAEPLSGSELLGADGAEGDDVLVVDEFVEDVDDEFEDVAEPSKPQGPLRP